MAIKMRVSKDAEAQCDSCGATKEEALDLFDVKVGSTLVVVCDECMEALFNKALSAKCHTNGRVKSPREIKTANARARKKKAALLGQK